MTASFDRELGNESGVQLNALVDNSALPNNVNPDQSFAIAMRSTRGRIDRAFPVTSSNFELKLGHGETIRKNPINEAWVQAFEALNNGAEQAAVVRLVGDDSALNWIVLKQKTTPQPTKPTDQPSTPTPQPSTPTDQPSTPTDQPSTPTEQRRSKSLKNDKKPEFDVSVAQELKDTDYDIAIRHLECFNDGIKVSIYANEKRVNGKNVSNNVITLNLLDSKGNNLHSFTGSLDENARDDFGNSAYLPDIIESKTDEVEIRITENLKIDPDSEAYGFDENGNMKRFTSAVQKYFYEGVVGNYTTQTYVKARELLEKTQLEYRYIASGGSMATALLVQLGQLAFNTNRQMRYDIHGELTVEQVLVFQESLNVHSMKEAHLIQCYWSPIKTIDPTGINGKVFIGTSGLNIGLACRRNAVKNYKGFAAKNYPIAGKLFPIKRGGVVQVYTPSKSELSQLAAAKVNPVIYQTYETVGLYVFNDSLTCAPVEGSLKKLIAVVEMSTAVDDFVTATAKASLQLPMKKAIERMDRMLKKFFEDAQSADWLDPSSDPQMGGASFRYEVKPNIKNPYEQMTVNYWVRYDGTARQIFATQTLSK